MNRLLHTPRTGPFMAIVLAALVALHLSSCGSSSPTDPDSSDATQNGTLTVMMVDAPTDEICELWVYIQDLRVKPDGQPPVILGNEEIGLVELLKLREGPPAHLVSAGVEQGRYQFIEILLDQERSFVVESAGDDPGPPSCPGPQVPLQIPSEKFKINGGPFEVTRNTTITIDFDAKKSLKRKGSEAQPKGWKLKPDISLVEIDP